MTTDPLTTAGLVKRQVCTGEREGVPTRTTIARRVYRTDQRDLWDAVTNIERIPRWFSPVSGTLELAGRYQIEGNAGGTIETCTEPGSFSVTWEYAGSLSWVAVALSPVDGGTQLEVAHESPVDPGFWAQYGPGATGLGWDLSLLGLGWYVEDGQEFAPTQAVAFTASPEGAALLEAAGTDWADAAIADGDDDGAAQDAAKRSVAFFTPPDGTSTD